MKVILINGAPGSGKDILANALIPWLWDEHGAVAQNFKLSEPLKRFAADLFKQPIDVIESRAWKDSILHSDEDGGITTGRDFLISISEDLVKPNLGRNWFALQLAKKLTDIDYWRVEGVFPNDPDIALVTDAGFQVEADTLSAALGLYNVACIQIHRPGHTFENDSREPVTAKRTCILNNTTDLASFLIKGGQLVEELLKDMAHA